MAKKKTAGTPRKRATKRTAKHATRKTDKRAGPRATAESVAAAIGTTPRPDPTYELIDADAFAAEDLFDVTLAITPAGVHRQARVRQQDMMTMLFDGTIPAPLLEAGAKLIDVGGQVKQGGLSVFTELSEDDRRDMLSMLRRYACSACVQPQFSMPPEPGQPVVVVPGSCPVTRL